MTPQSMTAAYAAFANQGEVPKPITIRRVEDRDGRVLFTAEESSTKAISPTTAFLMSKSCAPIRIVTAFAAGSPRLPKRNSIK